MDRQCKKQQQTIYIWTDSAKNCTGAFTVLQTVQKKTTTAIYIWTDSAKKTTTAIYIWTDSAKKTTAIYIWTVHIYRLYRRQCAKYTYMHSVRLVYYRDILNYRRHIIHRKRLKGLVLPGSPGGPTFPGLPGAPFSPFSPGSPIGIHKQSHRLAQTKLFKITCIYYCCSMCIFSVYIICYSILYI